jgi:DNA-directed RNA polymerase specialized sigma24 family protein
MPSEMVAFLKSVVAAATSTSNILFWMESSYWDVSNELKPLLHTWSLAVEEQFYVLFPLLLTALMRIGYKGMVFVLGLLTIISLCLSIALFENAPIANFYMLPTRAWELLSGSLIALYQLKVPVHSKKKMSADLPSAFGILMICYAMVFFDETTPFPGLYTLLPVAGTSLIIIYASANTVVGKLLSLKPFVFIGLISYSAYLWHQPVFVLIRYLSNEVNLIPLSLTLIPLSYFTYRYIERPFRKRSFLSSNAIFKMAATGSLVFIVYGVTGAFMGGLQSRSVVKVEFNCEYQPDNKKLQLKSWSLLDDPSYNPRFDESNPNKNVLLIGNSHSKDLYNCLANSDYSKREFEIRVYQCQIHELSATHRLFYSEPYIESDVVFIVSRYSSEDCQKLPDLVNRLTSDQKEIVIARSLFEFKYSAGKTTADRLLQNKFLDQLERGEIDITEAVKAINSAYTEEYEAQQRTQSRLVISDHAIDRLSDEYQTILILDRMDYIYNQQLQQVVAIDSSLNKYFYDYGHHTLEGAAFFGSRIDAIDWLEPLKERFDSDNINKE